MEKKKRGRPAKFVVRLTPEERARLEGMIRCGKGPARELVKARILLKGLMHFVQMVLNFDKMLRQINHGLQDADGV